MIKRDARGALVRLAEQFPVVAITGPRQSGKSTLAQMAFPAKRYVSFDDKQLRELAKSNPGDFLKAFPDGVAIDEAQKVPELFDAIKLVVDNSEYDPGKYILTGSSQFRLKQNISDSLAGRIGMINLLPLSIQELKEEAILSDDAYDYVFNGFYPPLYDEEKHFNRDDWFENYQINPSNVNAFRKFIQVCATRSGQMVNYEGLSRSIGVSAVTIKAWLSVLEASFIIHFLEADSNNLGKSIIKTPKMYFVDPGLMCYLLRLDSKEELLLDDHKGAVVETMAVSELLKQRLNAGKKPNLTWNTHESLSLRSEKIDEFLARRVPAADADHAKAGALSHTLRVMIISTDNLFGSISGSEDDAASIEQKILEQQLIREGLYSPFGM